jgi:hypothetical protein
MRCLLLLALAVLPMQALGAQTPAAAVPGDPVLQAREAYDRGDYSAAIGFYRNLVKTGADSAELFYNLGNAEFKAGQLGLAIADYRKALKRAPEDEDVLYNLNYVRTFIHQPGERKGPLANWLESVFTSSSSHGLVLGALVFFWILAAFMAVLIYTHGSQIWLRWVTAGLALVFLILAGWGTARITLERNTLWGVIIASRSEARNGPSPEFQVGFVIPEGREVRVLGHEGSWVAVGLPSEGYKGWIKREDLAEDE